MHILYVTACAPYSNGETFILTEICALQRLGIKVTIVPRSPEKNSSVHSVARELEKSAIAVGLFSLQVLWLFISALLRSPRQIYSTVCVLAKSRTITIFLKNLVVLPKALWCAKLAREIGVDHIHAHWLGTSSTMAMIASQFSGISWSATGHRWDLDEDNLIEEKLKTIKFLRVISLTGLKQLGRFGSDLLVHIPMGVDLTPDYVGCNYKRASKNICVVTAANLVPKKGLSFLIHAIKDLTDQNYPVNLDIFGDGPLRTTLQQLINQFDLTEHICLHHALNHEILLSDMQNGRWDIACLPSILTVTGEHEGIPVFLMEAMAAGLPVVSTPTGAIEELVVPGCGILVPAADAKALAHALTTLAQDPKLRLHIGERAKQRVFANFSSEYVANKLASLFSAAQR